MEVNKLTLSENITIPAIKDKISRNRFEFMNIIGRGAFGKVWKVVDKKDKRIYAIKEMRKVKILNKKSEQFIKSERIILSQLRHPFIVNMHYAFQDYENLYIALDYLKGGDLRYHLLKNKQFSEKETRFLISCMIIALEYIHSRNIIHKDVKPENMVFDENGYLRITDFGIAKDISFSNGNNGNEVSGTPGYMSPEVITGQKHSFGVDYFAIGVIGYELMFGKRPYTGKTKKEIREQMMSKTIEIHLSDLPKNWSGESADFITRLLERKPENRLGYNNKTDIKNHPWLKFYPWNDITDKLLKSPFPIIHSDNFDKRYCEKIEKIGAKTQYKYNDYFKRENYASLFKGYTYYYENELQINDEQKPFLNSKHLPNLIEAQIHSRNVNHDNSNSVSSLKKSMSNYDIFVKRKNYSICNNSNSNSNNHLLLNQKENINIEENNINLLSNIKQENIWRANNNNSNQKEISKKILLNRNNSYNNILFYQPKCNPNEISKSKACTSSSSPLSNNKDKNTILFSSRNIHLNPYMYNKSFLHYDNSIQSSLLKINKLNHQSSQKKGKEVTYNKKKLTQTPSLLLNKSNSTALIGNINLQRNKEYSTFNKAMNILTNSMIEYNCAKKLSQDKTIEKYGNKGLISVPHNRNNSKEKKKEFNKMVKVKFMKPTSVGLFHKIRIID